MKRSEMLQFLEIVLTAPRLDWNDRLVASEILDGLEQKGMLPPQVFDYPEQPHSISNCKWENEDLR